MSTIIDSLQNGYVTYQLIAVSCGKVNCRKCPHGPYWYALIQINGGKTIRRYLGKQTPKTVTDVRAKPQPEVEAE
jgi:hypothetical protein